jgi:hypothetical protein
MNRQMSSLNNEVTTFLDQTNHPLRKEIELLRTIVLNAVPGLTENVKWNGPNYCFENEDRITMRIHPPKQTQLNFYRGVKKLTQPNDKIIDDNSRLLDWKENDRAVASFKDKNDIEKSKSDLEAIVNKRIQATKSTTTNR